MGVLSDAKVRAAKPTEKAYKLSDGEQLYLFVSPSGARSWRLNYKFGTSSTGKPAQKTLTIGSYPAVSLKDAREARDAAKALLAKGREPKPGQLFMRNEGRATFRKVADQWLALQQTRWSTVHTADVLENLKNDVFPTLGEMPIDDIQAPDVLGVLQSIVDRGAIQTAHRARQRISAIFTYGIVTERNARDPAAGLAIALPRKPKSKPQPGITDLDDLRKLLIDCENERCRAPTKLALRLLELTAVRPNELHGARWDEFEDLDGKQPLWRIPSHRMKGDQDRKGETGGDHLVPLAPASVEILRVMYSITGALPLVFSSDRHFYRPMSENTLRALLIRAGYCQRHVPHGFRSAFSTIMNERVEREWRQTGHAGASPDRAIIDLMLAHVPKDKVEGAYNRAAYMERRREIADAWADLLVKDMCPPGAHIGQPIRWAATGKGRPIRS